MIIYTILLFLCLLCGVVLLSYNIYTYFEMHEKSKNESGMKVFMDAYHQVKREREQNE